MVKYSNKIIIWVSFVKKLLYGVGLKWNHYTIKVQNEIVFLVRFRMKLLYE